MSSRPSPKTNPLTVLIKKILRDLESCVQDKTDNLHQIVLLIDANKDKNTKKYSFGHYMKK